VAEPADVPGFFITAGFPKDDPDIQKGLDWFIRNQQPDGLWRLESGKDIKAKDTEERLWLGLSVCRLLKRYYLD